MKNSTKFKTILISYFGFILISLSTSSFAETKAMSDTKLDIGKAEYESACAVCHGVDAKGTAAPLKELLTRPVPDLTALAKNNKGVFPFDRVYQVIDGRQEVKAHGTRNMPVWGARFNNQSSLYFENYPATDKESAARSRILALLEYLFRLQE